jgi:Tol biopolymer transport system component
MQIHSIETIIHDARNPKWSPDGTKIAFMRLVGDSAGTGSYEVYLANPDGSGEIGISEICPDLTPGKHKGASSWHPSGRWILLIVEKDDYLFSDRPDVRALATVGIGLNTDMWLLAADGSKAWRLTDVPTKMEEDDTTPFTGILHPQFNHSGDRILYTFTESPGTDVFGDWEIRIAEFTAPPQATVNHAAAQVYEPGDKHHWYETHSWSPDDSTIYFSFSPNVQQDDLTTDIGTLNLSNDAYENLTDSWQVEGEPWDGNSAWDEHAYISKDGSKVLFISSNGFPMPLDDESLRKKWRDWLITEMWWMGPMGENQERLSYFNDPTAPEFIGSGQKVVCSGPNWNPETTAFTCVLGIRHQDPVTDETLTWDFDIKIAWLDLDQNGLRDADENRCGNGICEADETADSCPRDCLIDNISIIQKKAAHGSFAPDDSRIVVDRSNDSDPFYDLYVIDLDGNTTQSLTDGNPLVNQRGNSWPVWHPTEDYIVFQSEEEQHWLLENTSLSDPGLGLFHNLYAMRIDGEQIWKLTDIPIKQTVSDEIPVYACVNPTFNMDGSKLMWTERYKGDEIGGWGWGFWRIKMADFIIGPNGPELQNIMVVLDPSEYCGSNDCQYANGMAFIDDATILVAGNLNGQHVYGMDLYRYDLTSKQLTNLLDTPEYWEEGAAYANGRIVYMTNIDSEYRIDFNDPDWPNQPRTREYWIMNSDGSNKRRLTYFNSPHSPEYQDLSQERRTIVAKCSFSHDGSKMIGTVGFDNGGIDTVEMTLNLGLFEYKE